MTDSEVQIDKNLVEWLESIGASKDSIDKITKEEYTLFDFLHHLERNDLKRINLRLVSI